VEGMFVVGELADEVEDYGDVCGLEVLVEDGKSGGGVW
jgi:hypothetical protein